MMHLLKSSLLYGTLLLNSQLKTSWAVLPDAELWIESSARKFSTSSPLLVSYGLFGAAGAGSDITGPLTHPPEGDDLLCNEANGLVDYRGNYSRVPVNATTTTTTTTAASNGTLLHNAATNSTRNNANATTIVPSLFPLPLYHHREILLVPRGNCTFEHKALSAQRLGASGILIYNTLQSRYRWNATSQRVIYPLPQDDFECSNGQDSNISAAQLQLDPPSYNSTLHDPLLTLSSPSNLCHLTPSTTTTTTTCASQRCLVTDSATDNETGVSVFSACCAWDISVTMNANANLEEKEEPVHIVAVFLTMAQGDSLLSLSSSTSSSSATIDGTTTTTTLVSIRPRPRPKWNASFFLLCLMGTIAVTLAAWNSAYEYRYTMLRLRQHRQQRELRQRGGAGGGGGEPRVESGDLMDDRSQQTEMSDEDQDHDLTMPCPTTSTGSPPSSSSSPAASPPLEQALPPSQLPPPQPPRMETAPTSSNPSGTTVEGSPMTVAPSNQSGLSSSIAGMFRGSPLESVEMEIWHVAVFLVVASTLLFLLFFFKFYRFVVVLYAFGCAGAVSLTILRPILERVGQQLCARRSRTTESGDGIGNTSNNNNSDNENYVDANSRTKPPTFLHKFVLPGLLDVTWLDVISAAGGYLWSALWLFVYFTRTDPSRMAFYWISQDIFGLALCILILSLIKLNSMKIGTVLLVAVFFYDIFFVFLTPYLFDGKSIMVSVATSGGSPEGAADFCEKYPSDRKCRGGNPLPFLFTIPHIHDYRGGSSLLGLGDVVLPGILLSFAARLDGARRLLNRHTTLRLADAPERWYQGYFPPLIVAYLVGLLMANCAVVWMQRGQPALLYLVPSCLGTLLVLGRHELRDLWKGPKHLRWADRLMRYVLRRV